MKPKDCKRPLASAIQFFFEHAGYSTPPGRKTVAKQLARAECEASKRGWEGEWDPDEDPDLSWMTPEERRQPHEVYCVGLRGSPGDLLVAGPICGVVSPDRNYRRVLEAELADEALKLHEGRARATKEAKRAHKVETAQKTLFGRARK